jgi:hypothetical protein
MESCLGTGEGVLAFIAALNFAVIFPLQKWWNLVILLHCHVEMKPQNISRKYPIVHSINVFQFRINMCD